MPLLQFEPSLHRADFKAQRSMLVLSKTQRNFVMSSHAASCSRLLLLDSPVQPWELHEFAIASFKQFKSVKSAQFKGDWFLETAENKQCRQLDECCSTPLDPAATPLEAPVSVAVRIAERCTSVDLELVHTWHAMNIKLGLNCNASEILSRNEKSR